MKKRKNLPACRRQKRRYCRVVYNLFLPIIFLMVCITVIFSITSNTIFGEIVSDKKETIYSNEETIQESYIMAIDDMQNNEALLETEDVDVPWYLTLVNYKNPIMDAEKDSDIHLVKLPGGEKVDERIYAPLMEMLDAAKELGPVVVSGFRTQEKQQSLYNEKIREYKKQGYSEDKAIELARQWVAEPGTSEHQLGLAVDINGATYDIYFWLQENSYKYGFIFRYPGNKTDLTGVAEEVWHYRYVGKEAAKIIYENGICLEEYVENPQSQDMQSETIQSEVSYEQYKLYEGEWIIVDTPPSE